MLIFASNNEDKLREIRQILKGYEIKSLKQMGIDIEVKEDKDTFYGNALKKAKTIYDMVNIPCIADDSGLCIDYFNGWPGVKTARFLGENKSARERNEYILDKMKNLKDIYRKAKVVCNLVYYNNEEVILGEGILEGKISNTLKGSNGFGFDEIFELDSGKTLAQLESSEKNSLSARYLAMIDLSKKLNINK